MSFFDCWKHFLTSIMDYLDDLLTRETLEKCLKSERLKLEKKVNSKKCLFYHLKIF